MTRILKLRRFVALVALVSLAATVPSLEIGAKADEGDNLASFDAALTAGIPYCGVGTGLAFDGANLLLTCWGSNVIERVDPVTHGNNGALTISGLSDINAIAYDRGRDALWACTNHSTVVLIDLEAQQVDATVPSFTVAACTDGLAYDGADDTLWVSPDASSTIYHYNLDGTLIASWTVSPLLGGCGNSGIAVGGEKLYLANNGCSQIWEVDKDLTTSRLLSSFPRRLEDLECDGQTFPGKGAIWSQDAYDRELNAWEIPSGLCELGGGSSSASESYTAAADTAQAYTGKLGRSASDSEGTDSQQQAGGDLPEGAGSVGVGRTSTSGTVDGFVNRSDARSTVTDVSLAGGLVKATKVEARAHAEWDRESKQGMSTSAGSAIANLEVGGVPVAVEGPNQTVPLPGGGQLTIREEIAQTPERGRALQVNMLHLSLPEQGIDVVVGAAFAGAGSIEAPSDTQARLPQPPSPDDPPALPLPTASLLSEDFEDGAPDWTATTAEGTPTPVWQIGAPVSGPDAAKGGAKIAGTVLDGAYPVYADARLNSPVIDLRRIAPSDLEASGTRLVLRWQQWFASNWYDCGRLRATVNGTATIDITPTGGYPQSNPWCYRWNYVPGAYMGDQSGDGWVEQTADLTSLAGTQVVLSFEFESYYYNYWSYMSGWSIDDVSVSVDRAA